MDTITLTYTEAASELENILRELENDQLDVDQVVERVKRAQELLAHCRDKVAGAKAAVSQVLAGE